MKTMREIADRVLVIFEFEKAIYERANVPVDWVGHPLLDVMPPLRAARARSCAASGWRPRGRWLRCCPEAAETSCGRSCPRLVDAAQRFGRSSLTFSSSSRARRTFDDDLFAPLESLSSAPNGHRRGPDRSRARGGGCRDRRVGDGHRAGRAARCPMVVVYRLSPVTYRAGPTLRPRRYIRDGQPRRGPASRARN